MPYVINGITQQQLNDTLKTYATNTSVDTKLEEYASKDEIPASLPADGGNADTVGGKSAEELIQSNPNLLLNPDFKVNQRGKSEYSSTVEGYSLDRWKTSGIVKALDDGGIEWTHLGSVVGANNDHYNDINQYRPADGIFESQRLVTLSACINGQVYSASGRNCFAQTFTIDGHQVELIAWHGPSYRIRTYGEEDYTITVSWVKLELGDIATPFVPPNPLEEALKCGSLENAEQQIFYGDGVWANAPSNPNLLDNPDFKINQRGKSEYTAEDTNIYTVDRWKVGFNNTCIVEEGGIIVRNNADSRLQLYQYVDRSFKDLAGKRLTMSVKFANDEAVCSVSGTVPLVAPTDLSYIMHIVLENGFTLGMWYSTAVKRVVYQIIKSKSTNGESIKIEWAKCEMGAAPTPFTPPDPATELLKCQRYYQRLGGQMLHVGTGYANAAGTESFAFMAFCPLPTTMRTMTPTVNIHGQLHVWISGHYGSSSFTTNRLVSSAGALNLLTLPLGITSTDVELNRSLLNAPGSVQFRDTESYIEMSADL